jgi:hypothetical protein
MRAHRIKVQVSASHEVRITLPSDFPPGEAEVIVLGGEPEASAKAAGKLTVDELLAARLSPPAGVGPISLADIEKAIADGASGRGGL